MALLLHWKFDEISGTTAADSSGNGYDGTLVGLNFSTDSVTGPGGTLNGALQFTSADTVHDTIPTGQTAFTVAFWVKHNDSTFLTTEKFVFSFCNHNTNTSISYEHNQTWVGGGGGWAIRFDRVWYSQGGAGWDPGIWHHIAITYDGTNLRVYRDAVLIYTSGTVAGKTISGNGLVTVGSRSNTGTDTYPGKIDDFRIYNHVLTLSDIEDLYDLASSGTTAPVTTATEHDLGISLGTVTSSPVSTAIEHDLGVVIETAMSAAITTAVEHDLGFSLEAGTSFAITTAIEHDIGIAPGVSFSNSIGTATEDDIAVPPSVSGTTSISTAIEHDVAIDLGSVTSSSIQAAIEHDIGNQVGVVTGDSIDTAIEHDIGQTLVVPPPPSSITVAVEHDVAIQIVTPTVVTDLQVLRLTKSRSLILAKSRKTSIKKPRQLTLAVRR